LNASSVDSVVLETSHPRSANAAFNWLWKHLANKLACSWV